jgi:hypothetical protein
VTLVLPIGVCNFFSACVSIATDAIIGFFVSRDTALVAAVAGDRCRAMPPVAHRR